MHAPHADEVAVSLLNQPGLLEDESHSLGTSQFQESDIGWKKSLCVGTDQDNTQGPFVPLPL
jgi:hypothetical protein